MIAIGGIDMEYVNPYNAPGPSTDEDANPHSRTVRLLGVPALQALHSSHVLVAGLGGVGSYAVEALARCGIGKLSLVDYDRVTLSNLNRQLYALHSTLGQLKTEVAAKRIADINPDCSITLHTLRITEDNVADLLKCKPDLVLDAIDDLSAKTALLSAARHMNIPVVSVLGTANRSDANAGFIIADIAATHTCPLARTLRQKLRLAGITEGITVVFSPHTPQQRGALGSTSYVPGQAGLIAAGQIVQWIIDN